MSRLTKHMQRQIAEYYEAKESEDESVSHIDGEWIWDADTKTLSGIKLLGNDNSPYAGIWLKIKIVIEYRVYYDKYVMMPYFTIPIVHPNVACYTGFMCVGGDYDTFDQLLIPYLNGIRYLIEHPGYDNQLNEDYITEEFYNSYAVDHFDD